MEVHQISSDPITCKEVMQIVESGITLKLSEESIHKVKQCRDFLDDVLSIKGNKIYGVNTGYGSLHNVEVSLEDQEELQEKLVLSHDCATGNPMPIEVVKVLLLLKIKCLALGHSGVKKETLDFLIELYNRDIIPIIYEQGSLGASGDLAPLAHMSLPLIGEGEVYYKGQRHNSFKILKKIGLRPLRLEAKEGLALLNGTQLMGAYGVWMISRFKYLLKLADFISTLSLEAFDGRAEPFDPGIHEVRKHRGQNKVAQNVRYLLDGSELITSFKQHTQDPYSFRCIPQVHGASRDALEYVDKVFEIEINSVTDNPIIFPDKELILSGGNFHGQPLALALEQLCLAMAEIGSISERRTYKLLSGQRALPPFLIEKPGLNSGFMIVQYVSASMVSQNKQYCTPAVIDSIDSSQGQEDHVSMGANSALKLKNVFKNVEKILAYEFFTAAQALQFRRPKRTSGILEAAVAMYRQEVPFLDEDDLMYPHMNKTIEFIQKLKNTNFLSSII